LREVVRELRSAYLSRMTWRPELHPIDHTQMDVYDGGHMPQVGKFGRWDGSAGGHNSIGRQIEGWECLRPQQHWKANQGMGLLEAVTVLE